MGLGLGLDVDELALVYTAGVVAVNVAEDLLDLFSPRVGLGGGRLLESLHQRHQIEHQLQVERRGLRVLQPEQLLEAAHLVRVRVRLRGRVKVWVRARVRVRVKLLKAAHLVRSRVRG